MLRHQILAYRLKDEYPFDPNYPYRPKKASLDELLAFEKELGIDHVCLICMSVYGTDNRSMMAALRQLKGHARAIVCIDPATITEQELQEMHQLGARGVRVNLKTRNEQISKETLAAKLLQYADKIRHHGWVIQVYFALDQIPLIVDVIPELNIPLVIDHMGSPNQSTRPSDQPGYAELLNLLERKLVWVKISGIYRFPNTPELDAYGREIIRKAPTQVVWVSDWPHSGGVEKNINGNRHVYQDYRKIDDAAFVEKCLEWCDFDEKIIQLLFVENPRRLWRYEGIQQ
ncbi:uncharacterized protein A1O5_06468 [Cladophialophora psammophila CBS 110553]|uniref:Amidohydrolase-related domain-containing protein n=1 Tax=Cladophialophora psammophila CBS 110553 TaxID=1182543 RepID=W9WZC9_9EURO|nr:uncharacterized protein A1O5_06468 [Cladophialophora psammophila CBS 110553]EXJ70400.1 hypothetical protein A1O5_06468 [Cladophialophora psammophila CBS 110553]